MAQELSYAVFDTAAGWMGILGSTRGILRTTLPRRTAPEALRFLGKSANYAICAPDSFQELMERFRSYFNGQQTTFAAPLDLSHATVFQRKVWETTRLIPYGEIRSYAWLAQQVRNPQAARAVGQALGTNPLPIIIPCHRVLASNGRLGGYSGGLKVKRQLLKLEGLTVTR